MKHQKSVIEVKIRLDPVPGWGNDPQDHMKMLEKYLNDTIPHYKPEVRIIKIENES